LIAGGDDDLVAFAVAVLVPAIAAVVERVGVDERRRRRVGARELEAVGAGGGTAVGRAVDADRRR
jgi:hypothetical protein